MYKTLCSEAYGMTGLTTYRMRMSNSNGDAHRSFS